MTKVVIPLANGFEEIEAFTLVDVLRRAEIDVKTAGLEKKMAKGAHGVVVEADTVLDEIQTHEYDMIVLPGGLPGAEYLAKSEKVQKLLQKFNSNGKKLGAICAAPWALKTAGVLKNKYTCYPSFEDTIEHDGYTPEQNVIKDENIMTSRGPATAMEFALAIVKELCGEKVYNDVKNGLLA